MSGIITFNNVEQLFEALIEILHPSVRYEFTKLVNDMEDEEVAEPQDICRAALYFAYNKPLCTDEIIPEIQEEHLQLIIEPEYKKLN